jgi:hypothetical protein
MKVPQMAAGWESVMGELKDWLKVCLKGKVMVRQKK